MPLYSKWSLGVVLISLSQATEPVGGCTTESVTHGQCDARPTVTFPANGRYQFILLGERNEGHTKNTVFTITATRKAELRILCGTRVVS